MYYQQHFPPFHSTISSLQSPISSLRSQLPTPTPDSLGAGEGRCLAPGDGGLPAGIASGRERRSRRGNAALLHCVKEEAEGSMYGAIGCLSFNQLLVSGLEGSG